MYLSFKLFWNLVIDDSCESYPLIFTCEKKNISRVMTTMAGKVFFFFVCVGGGGYCNQKNVISLVNIVSGLCRSIKYRFWHPISL